MSEVKLYSSRKEKMHVEDCAGMLHSVAHGALLQSLSRSPQFSLANAKSRWYWFRRDAVHTLYVSFYMEGIAVCADLFAMLKALEHLERAYIKDWVKPEEYEKACERLISQFKAHYTGPLKAEISSIDGFADKFSMIVPKAIQRLSIGMPATREHLIPTASTTGNSHSAVMTATSALITAIDTVRLGMSAVDQILPQLISVVDALRQLRLPTSFQGYTKIKDWVTELNNRPAHHELAEDQLRQLAFDLEDGYRQFEEQIKKGI